MIVRRPHLGGKARVIIGRSRTHASYCPLGCVCRFLLINFKTLRIFFRAGARGPEGTEGGENWRWPPGGVSPTGVIK